MCLDCLIGFEPKRGASPSGDLGIARRLKWYSPREAVTCGRPEWVNAVLCCLIAFVEKTDVTCSSECSSPSARRMDHLEKRNPADRGAPPTSLLRSPLMVLQLLAHPQHTVLADLAIDFDTSGRRRLPRLNLITSGPKSFYSSAPHTHPGPSISPPACRTTTAACWPTHTKPTSTRTGHRLHRV